MRCQEVKNKLERYGDNALSGDERKAIEEHLSVCAGCRKELEVLKSIDSVGKIKFYPEPQPEYWKQLTRSVRNRIAGLGDKPSASIFNLKRIRDILWPSRVSYRLVRLTATAVVLFFVIRLSFVNRGKFELPTGLTEKESVKTVEVGTEPGKVQEAQKLAESMSRVKETPKETGEAPTLREMKISEPSIPTKKSEEKREHSIDETYKIAGGVVLSDKAVAPANEAIDEDVSYDLVYQKVEGTENISEKIKLWETFLRTNPESRFVKRIKYEQAQLYFMLAKQKMTAERINQALKFYRDNFNFMSSEENVENVKKQIKELNTLSEKIEKK